MEELIHNFGIDWKLLIAQAVNFFVLLFLLQKFAYGPILKMLHRRKEKIEGGIRFANEAEEKFRMSEKERERVLIQARGEALAIVSSSEDTAKKRGAEIVAESNKKVEAIVLGAKRTIEEEKAKMGEEVFHDAKELVREGIKRVIGKLPAKERDNALIDDALRELKSAQR